MKFKFILSLAVLALSLQVEAQEVDPEIVSFDNDSQYEPSLRPQSTITYYDHQNKILPWESVREIDVMWKKTVWREIDLRERVNSIFTYNNQEYGDGTFIEILLNAVGSGQVQAFSAVDDRFTTKMSPEEVKDLTRGRLDSVEVEDPLTGEMILRITRVQFNPRSVVKYRIKEETYFDKVRGKMFTHILGIAPLQDARTSSGVYIGEVPMFWVYYPDLRPVLVNHMVFNPVNDISTLTWDDIFEKRMFASNITQMSNEHQGRIRAYKGNGLDAYYESQKLQNEIFNKEQDLWVY